MTRHEKFAFIREKCIETNPEIIQLKLGCQIMMIDGTVGTILFEDSLNRLCILSEYGPLFKEIIIGREFVEKMLVLGRPIRLADVLLTLHKKNGANKTLLNVECDGQFVTGLNKTLGPTWNLRKDDLNEQDETLVSFLYDVLK